VTKHLLQDVGELVGNNVYLNILNTYNVNVMYELAAEALVRSTRQDYCYLAIQSSRIVDYRVCTSLARATTPAS
jgi:hypothetical protein